VSADDVPDPRIERPIRRALGEKNLLFTQQKPARTDPHDGDAIGRLTTRAVTDQPVTSHIP
jgi:hypothetical protein